MTIYEAEKIIGTMVACLSCQRIVWAHDSDWGDVRGLLNAMRLPCRLCGDENEFRGYDGWSITSDMVRRYGQPDTWATMRAIAAENDLIWGNGPSLIWFDTNQSGEE